jgi:hypothetical protein
MNLIEEKEHELRAQDAMCINESEIKEPWYANLKYLLVGIAFGIIFVKAEIISWYRIQEMFRLQSFFMYGVIGSAVMVGALSVFLIKKFNIKTIYGEKIEFHDKKFNKPFFASNLSNILNNQYPDGIGAEVFGFNYLDDLMNMRLSKEKKEHIHLNFFDYKLNRPINEKWCKIRTIKCPKEFRRPEICLDVNTIEDYKFISDIYENLYYIKPKFKITDIINYLDKKNEK